MNGLLVHSLSEKGKSQNYILSDNNIPEIFEPSADVPELKLKEKMD